MFDMTDTRRTSGAAIYRANRALGRPAGYALQTARYIAALLETLQAFTVELVWGQDTEAIYTLQDDSAGVTLTYELWRDTDNTPEDAECYSPEDLLAWHKDEWHYYGVTVTADMGRFSVTEHLGGIDAGDYWETPARPLDLAEQIMSSALEYFPVRAMIEAVQDKAIAICLQVTP